MTAQTDSQKLEDARKALKQIWQLANAPHWTAARRAQIAQIAMRAEMAIREGSQS